MNWTSKATEMLVRSSRLAELHCRSYEVFSSLDDCNVDEVVGRQVLNHVWHIKFRLQQPIDRETYCKGVASVDNDYQNMRINQYHQLE